MKNNTKIADATPIDDISGLKLDTSKPYSMNEIYTSLKLKILQKLH